MLADLEQLQVDLATLGLEGLTPISATSGDGMSDLYQLLQPLLDPVLQQYKDAVEAAADAAAVAVQHVDGVAAPQQQQQWQQQQIAAGRAAVVRGSMIQNSSEAAIGSIATYSPGELKSASALDDLAAVDELMQLQMTSSSSSAASDDECSGSSDDDTNGYLSGAFADGDAAGDVIGTAAADMDQQGTWKFNATAAPDAPDLSSSNSSSGSSSSSTVVPGPVRLAILGLPNAGKSTLMNQLLGYERSLTGEEFKQCCRC